MGTPSDLWDPAELGTHTEWVRGLAVHLVKDAARADDLVQETFLAALEKRPATGSSLRPWLRRVLQHRFAFGVRSDARRRAREADGAAREALPSSDELVESAEAHAMLVRELTRLREPYRTALLLRFFQGKTPQEIAQQQGVPPATVRSHLKRGLAELRERLDRHDGDGRRSWALALIPLAAASPDAVLPGGPLTSLAKSIRAMNPLTQTLVGSTLLIATAALAARQLDLLSPPGPQPAAVAPGAAAPALAAAAAPASAASARKSVAPGSGGLALTSEEQPITGVVVDSGSGAPLPGFTLELRPYTLDDDGNMVFDKGAAESLVTGEDGSFASERTYAAGTQLFLRRIDDPGSCRVQRSKQPTLAESDVRSSSLVWDPDEAPIHVKASVGPTYTLALTAPFDWRSTELIAYLGADEEEPWSVLQSCSLLLTPVRVSDVPCVRFVSFHPSLLMDRPWVLRVETPDGLFGGETQVPVGDGVHEEVVPVTIVPTAKLVVNLLSDTGVSSSTVIAQALNGDARRVLLGGAQEQQPDGRFRCCRVLGGIPPGQYDLLVTCGGVAPLHATVTLHEGEVLTHDIQVPLAPALSYVRGELHSVSGQYQHGCTIVLRARTSDEWRQVALKWEEQGGEWVAPFDIPQLSEGEYDLTLYSSGDYLRWTPLPATVMPPVEDLVLTCQDTEAVRSLKVVATDALSGAPVAAPFAFLTVDGCATSSVSTGTFFDGVPLDASFTWWACADGYVPKWGDQDDVSGTEPFEDGVLYLVPVAMQPGWGARIHARRLDTGGPLEGLEVLVDGQVVGTTDGAGQCDLTLTGPPTSVELRRAGWHFVSGLYDPEQHELTGGVWPVKTVRFEQDP